MIPLYIFYSMFGFQRTADELWAAADQMTRGFLLGATAGRTTLNGEGLQHEDGHSLLIAATNPAVVAYDPAFGVRDRAHHGGRPAPDVRRDAGERLLLPDGLQRADPAAGRAGRASTSRACSRASTATRRRRSPTGPEGAHPGLRHRHAVGAQGPAAARPGLGRRRRRLVGDLLDRAAPRRGRVPRSTTCCTPDDQPQVPYVTAEARRRRRARRSRSATGCGRCPT